MWFESFVLPQLNVVDDGNSFIGGTNSSVGVSQLSRLRPHRKPGWPMVRQVRCQAPPPHPRSSTGCSWMMTWKMGGTHSPSQIHVTCSSLSMTPRSTCPPWRRTSPTESPQRSAIGCFCLGGLSFNLINVRDVAVEEKSHFRLRNRDSERNPDDADWSRGTFRPHVGHVCVD